ncbi:MAG: ABC transporter permease [Bacilli bacterium]|nr:ABC transporter permease [Bacilli bacterium]
MFVTLLKEALRLTPIFLFGSTGETLTEKSGHLNLGTPGILCMGVAGGMVGISIYDLIFGGFPTNFGGALALFLIVVFMAMLFGALSGLLFSFFCVSLRCNQNVMGLAYTTFGIGFYGLVFNSFESQGKGIFYFNEFCYTINTLFMKDAEATNAFEKLFLANGGLWYMSFIIAIVVAIILKRTRVGLNIRAVGENAGSADAAGINVSKYRYLTTIIGSAISALGGLYYFVEINIGLLEFGKIDTYGWLAVALVIFTLWKTDLGVLGAFLFAFLFKLPEIYGLPSAEFNMLFLYLPYFITILVLLATSIFDRKAGQAPGNLGITYFREER